MSISPRASRPLVSAIDPMDRMSAQVPLTRDIARRFAPKRAGLTKPVYAIHATALGHPRRGDLRPWRSTTLRLDICSPYPNDDLQWTYGRC